MSRPIFRGEGPGTPAACLGSLRTEAGAVWEPMVTVFDVDPVGALYGPEHREERMRLVERARMRQRRRIRRRVRRASKRAPASARAALDDAEDASGPPPLKNTSPTPAPSPGTADGGGGDDA